MHKEDYIMSIYDQRDKPAYENFRIEPNFCQNSNILKWWQKSHDDLLLQQIKKEQWVWYWGITDKIIQITPSEELEFWKKDDPLCSHYAWYNVLMYFAASRAEKLGFTKIIRDPIWKICPFCNQEFIEDSLPYPLIQRLGINQIDFCGPCLKETLLQSGKEAYLRQEVLSYLNDLTDAIKRIPNQDFGKGIGDILYFTTEERLTILNIVKNKPSLNRIKKLFGSWLNALIESGILEHGTRRTGRGTQCIAKDGHVCFSLAEKTIDDFLFERGIIHGKEPKYPEGNFRADFIVTDIFIEYFGLIGDSEYEKKIKQKIAICNKHRINVIKIFAADLINLKQLESKLSSILSQKIINEKSE